MTNDEKLNKVIDGFLQDYPTLEEARKDLNRLGKKAVVDAARGKKDTWYHLARSVFRKPDGSRGDLYPEILPNLFLEVKWFQTMDAAKYFISEVKASNQRLRIEEGAKKRRMMTEPEVLEAFKAAFPSRENAEKAVLSSVPDAFIELNRKAFSMGFDRALEASAQ